MLCGRRCARREEKNIGRRAFAARERIKMKKSELNKLFNLALKNNIKQYPIKSRGGILYKKEGDYLVSFLLLVSDFKHKNFNGSSLIKPFIADDVFWEVFKMESNRSEPISLRANGAFTVDGLKVFAKHEIYNDVEDFDRMIKEFLEESNKIVSNIIGTFCNFDDYLLFSKTIEKKGLFDYELMKMLLLIYDGNYEKAKKLALEQLSDRKMGRFQNEGKWIYEHVVDYCNLHKGEKIEW